MQGSKAHASSVMTAGDMLFSVKQPDIKACEVPLYFLWTSQKAASKYRDTSYGHNTKDVALEAGSSADVNAKVSVNQLGCDPSAYTQWGSWSCTAYRLVPEAMALEFALQLE